MISSCNALGMLQLQLCYGAPGRGKEEGWEGCCRGDFGIQTFVIYSGTFISLAFGNLRLLEAAVPLLAEHRRALRLVRWADVDRSAPPASSGLTADTAAPQGNELLLRFLRRRISLMHQPGPFCKLRASSALWRRAGPAVVWSARQETLRRVIPHAGEEETTPRLLTHFFGPLQLAPTVYVLQSKGKNRASLQMPVLSTFLEFHSCFLCTWGAVSDRNELQCGG